MWTLLWACSWEMQRQPVETGSIDHYVCPFSITGKTVLSQCVMERGEHPVPRWASLQVSQTMRWKKVKRTNRDGAPGEQRENLGQQQKPGVRKELRDARWQREFGRKCRAEGCRVRSLGSSRCSVHWRDTSKVAPRPLLGSSSPGPVECISAQIYLKVRAALLASACDL